MSHDDKTNTGRPSVPAVTYTARPELHGKTFRCKRCGRVYPPPEKGAPVRCECGWWYESDGVRITERFNPRLGV